jgi:hypothetical protein
MDCATNDALALGMLAFSGTGDGDMGRLDGKCADVATCPASSAHAPLSLSLAYGVAAAFNSLVPVGAMAVSPFFKPVGKQQ